MPSSKPPKRPPADPDAWKRVGRQQLAELLGAHPDTVSDHTRAGMPVIQRGAPGKEAIYDAVECLAWVRERQGKNAKEAAQARQADTRARLNELEILKKQGELISAEEVVLTGQAYTRALTAKLRNLPKQLEQAGYITAEHRPALEAQIRLLLVEISSWTMVRHVNAAAKAPKGQLKLAPVNGGAHVATAG